VCPAGIKLLKKMSTRKEIIAARELKKVKVLSAADLKKFVKPIAKFESAYKALKAYDMT